MYGLYAEEGPTVERANRKNMNKLIESVCWFRGIKGAYLEDDYGN